MILIIYVNIATKNYQVDKVGGDTNKNVNLLIIIQHWKLKLKNYQMKLKKLKQNQLVIIIIILQILIAIIQPQLIYNILLTAQQPVSSTI